MSIILGQVARDRAGLLSLFLHTNELKKEESLWQGFGYEMHIDKDLFPFVTWEDPEPTLVKIQTEGDWYYITGGDESKRVEYYECSVNMLTGNYSYQRIHKY